MADLADSFRAAMRGLASSVCVIAARTDAGPRGMTATAVMSLCADPPALAFAVNRSARLNPDLAEGARVCVQLLCEEQAEVARAFAGGLAPEDRFQAGAWEPDPWGAPVLHDTAAALSCVVERRVELDTHTLVIAAVRDVRISPDRRPLLYAHGAFAALGEPVGRCAA